MKIIVGIVFINVNKQPRPNSGTDLSDYKARYNASAIMGNTVCGDIPSDIYGVYPVLLIASKVASLGNQCCVVMGLKQMNLIHHLLPDNTEIFSVL
jgi:hypothetical protein